MKKTINLTDYINEITWNKSSSYNKGQVDDIVEHLQLMETVTGSVKNIPINEIKPNKIYLELNDNNKSGNNYNFYVYKDGDWEQLDALNFDLTEYYTKSDIDSILSHMASENHSHGNLNNDGSFDNAINKNVVTDSQGNITTEEKYVHPSYNERIGKPVSDVVANFGDTINISQIKSDNQGHITEVNDRSIILPDDKSSSSSDGLMSKEDKNKLDLIEDRANNYVHSTHTPVTEGLYKITVDGEGHVINTNGVSDSDLPSHNHDSSDVRDTSAYSNIGSGANSSQKNINNNINTKLGLKVDKDEVYTKSQTLSSSEINQAIINGVSNVNLFEVVESLPTNNIKGNKFYLISNDKSINQNVYDIYIYVNNSWEMLDSLEFDIENYYNISQINSLLEGKVDNSDSRLNDSRVPKSHSHGNITNTGSLGTYSDKPLITGNNGVITTGSFEDNSINIKMNGEQNVGSSNTFARGDHIHPIDTSRASVNHNHGNINTDGSIGDSAGKPLITGVDGIINIGDFESSVNNIKMNGTVSPGSSNTFSRGDHVHPSDTNKVNISDVKDNLISTDSDKPLSANQGKVLKELLDGKSSSSHSHGSISNIGKLNDDISNVNKVVVTDDDNNIKSIAKLPLGNVVHQDISGKLNISDVKDDLVSDDSDKPLSAKQGKKLKSQIDAIIGNVVVPEHEHDTESVYDTSAYSNIGSSVNSSQKSINDKINIVLGQKANSNDVYTKSQTLSASEITQAIADGVSNVSLFEVVTALPTSNIKGNKFYLIHNNTTVNQNVYDIYIYVNNGWEQIDSLEFDIDNYYTIIQVDNLLNGKVDNTDSRLTDSRNPKSHTHGNITNTGAIGSTSGKIITTTTNGVLIASDNISTSQISNFPTSMTPTSHIHGSITNTGTLNSDITSVNKVVVTDSSNNVKTISKLPLGNVTHQDISGKINTSAIKNDLTTGGATNVLSAEQGKQLKAQIDSIINGETVTDHNHDELYYQKEIIDNKLNHKIDSIYITEDLELCYNIDTYFRSYTNNEDIGDLLPNKGHSLAELSVTSEGLLINSSNGEKRFNFPVVNPTELQFTYVSGELRGWVLGTLTDKTSRLWGDNNGTVWKIVNGVDSTQESVSAPTKANGDIIKVTFKDGLVSYYKNNTLLVSKEYEQVDDELYFGFYTNTNRNLVIKDVIIK